MGRTILSIRLMAVKVAEFDEKRIDERIKQVTRRPDLWTEELNQKTSLSQRSSHFGPWQFQRPQEAH